MLSFHTYCNIHGTQKVRDLEDKYVCVECHVFDVFLHEFRGKLRRSGLNIWKRTSCQKDFIFTMDIADMYHNKPWFWSELSYNPHLDFRIVEKYPDKRWCWKTLSRHKNINMKIVHKLKHKVWYWNFISLNATISFADVQKFPELPWSWYHLTMNPNMTLDIIKNNAELPWCLNTLYLNPNYDLMKDNDLNDGYALAAPWNDICRHVVEISFSIQILHKFIDKPLNWNAMCYKQSIIPYLLQKYKQETNDTCKETAYDMEKRLADKLVHVLNNSYDSWKYLSYNPAITVELIEMYIDKPWNWHALSSMLPINKDIIGRLDAKINWHGLSSNRHVTYDLIDSHINKPWSWSLLSYNSSLDLNIVDKYPQKPWDWKLLSNNPNITFNFIKRHINKDWNWKLLGLNPFILERAMCRSKLFCNSIHESLIQKLYHPKRLMHYLQSGYSIDDWVQLDDDR